MSSQQLPSRSRHIRTPSAPVSTQGQTRLRPAFNNLQQHYSPAKTAASKPLTATYLAPPTPSKRPANVAASAETSKLQAELLQLHLLHRDSAAVDARWRSSAKRKLGERFAALSGASRDIGRRERARAERENLIALRSWAAGGTLDDRIQALDGVVNGLWTMSEPGGRYARVVRRFERWLDRACEVEDARSSGGGAAGHHFDASLFVGELDAAWRDDCAGLARRLDGWCRQLQEMGGDGDGGGALEGPDARLPRRSSPARMLQAARAMTRDMLAELAAMEDMVREALAREDRWVEDVNRDEGDDDTPRAGAVWRVV